jgi:NDP-sugar pyrophosphorylase family protein
MILAGGLSTRLYPLTRQVPKPLVPVVGEPNAVHLIQYLHAYGFDEIAINVHYLADAIVASLGDGSQFGIKLTYLHEEILLGSAGALKQMEAFFADETFVVVGCDLLTDIPLDRLIAYHKMREALATIALVKRDEVDQYGVVVTGEKGKIVGFQEKPARGTEASNMVNTGVYVFEPAIFEHIPAATFYDFGKQVFPELRKADAAFYGYDAGRAYWCDIGTLDEYRRGTDDILAGVFKIPGARGNGADESARIAPGVIVEGDVWIGKDAVIEADAKIVGPSVIGDGVWVDRNVRIEASILWDGARVGLNATIANAIIGRDYNVPAAVNIDGAVLANE